MKRNKNTKKKKKKAKFHRRGQRYTQEQKQKALELLSQGETYSEVSRQIGPTTETIRLWKIQERLSKKDIPSQDPRPAPLLSPGGLSAVEVEAIRKHGKPEAVCTDRGGVFLDWGKETSGPPPFPPESDMHPFCS